MTVVYGRPSLLFDGYERFRGFGHFLDGAEHISDILRGLFCLPVQRSVSGNRVRPSPALTVWAAMRNA